LSTFFEIRLSGHLRPPGIDASRSDLPHDRTTDILKGGTHMVTTAKEARGKVCLLVMVNSCGNQMDICRPGECSAWEWEDARDDCGERLGHCALAGRAASLNGRGRKTNRS
jgi:hypothetical protein